MLTTRALMRPMHDICAFSFFLVYSPTLTFVILTKRTYYTRLSTTHYNQYHNMFSTVFQHS